MRTKKNRLEEKAVNGTARNGPPKSVCFVIDLRRTQKQAALCSRQPVALSRREAGNLGTLFLLLCGSQTLFTLS